MGTADSRHRVETYERTDAKRRTTGRRLDERLFAIPVAPLQKAGLQELHEHLSAVGDSSLVQHSVSFKFFV